MSNVLFHFPASVRALDNNKNSYHLNYERHQWGSRYYVLGCLLSQMWLAVKAKKGELLCDNLTDHYDKPQSSDRWHEDQRLLRYDALWSGTQFTGVSKKSAASLPAFHNASVLQGTFPGALPYQTFTLTSRWPQSANSCTTSQTNSSWAALRTRTPSFVTQGITP